MGGGPPAGAQRVDVPDDNSVLLMPTAIRTAAVTRWVGRGNGPSRVTGANACPAAGDCYKNNYPHRALDAARINTAHRRFHIAQRMARRSILRIRSGFTARRAAKGATGCGSLQFPMRSGARMARQAPARDRMSPLWQIMAHRHFGHWTAGRTRRARRSPTVDDSQRGPTDSGTMHRLLLGHITKFRGGSVARRKRCYSDIGLSVAIFLLNGLPPKENNDTLQTNPSQVTDDGREGRMGYARTQRRSRWTVNGRATLGIGQHRRCGCWQWVPVVRASSARSGVCGHGQLHRFLSLLIQRDVDRGSHSRTRLTCNTCEDVSNQCRATSSLHQAQPRTPRIRHWSWGAVRMTFRRFGALHVSLPVNRSHKPGNCMDGRQQHSISTYEGDSDQCGATSYVHGTQPREQRIRHWSRGAVRTTFRRFGALHVSLPVNRSHKPGNRMDGRQQHSISTYEGDSDQCGATSYLHGTQPREQRIRHWSRGAVRTTFRRFGALHVSLPVNRGYTPGNRRDGRWERTASTDEGNSNQCGATSYSFKAQSCTQRVWHRSKGTVRTTYRHAFAFHASLPVNRGYDPCAQAYQQAERGEWAKAEESLWEGLRRLAPLSRLVPTLVTQVEQCRREVEQGRRDVSGLTLAGESERAGMVGSVLLSLQSVGCYVGKT
jgi:hypothetical protein